MQIELTPLQATASTRTEIATEDMAVRHGVKAQLRQWFGKDAGFCCAQASLDLPIPRSERASVARAIPSRQAEFITGRWCSHRALEEFGTSAQTIPVGALGAPVWPQGVVGSITHESGICLAVVSSGSQFAGMGVDLFDTHRSTAMKEISHLILTEGELEASRLYDDEDAHFKLVFSAKESVVKAVSATFGRFIDLREIHLSIFADTFQARFNHSFCCVSGNWGKMGAFLLTSAVLEVETPSTAAEPILEKSRRTS